MNIKVDRGQRWQFGYIHVMQIKAPERIPDLSRMSLNRELAVPSIVTREIKVRELVMEFPPDVKDRMPESIRRHVDWLYRPKSAYVQQCFWEGTSPKQLLAKVNNRGNGVIFVRARRGKLQRKIKCEFAAKMLKARCEVDVYNKRLETIREEKYAYLMAVREPLYFAYDVASDTLFCSRNPHKREIEWLENNKRPGG